MKFRYDTFQLVNNTGADQTCTCAGWSAPLLLQPTENRFSRMEAHLVLSVDNICNSLGPDQARIFFWLRNVGLFDTVMVFLDEFFERVDFEKSQQTTKRHTKLLSRQRGMSLFTC